MKDRFVSFCEKANLILVVDHAGRAGNGFFQTIFDNHEEVLACPWLHYIYSYIDALFGGQRKISADAIREKWIPSTYFALLYYDLNPKSERLIEKMGAEDSELLNREIFRQSFDSLLHDRGILSRKQLVSAVFFSYALAIGRDPATVRFVMATDSVSLKEENVRSGFSGRVVDNAMLDFPKAVFIHLERDPRAGIASSRHQFVNQLGNAHASCLGLNLRQIRRLLAGDFGWDGPYVFGFWLAYYLQTYKAVKRLKARYSGRVVSIRNEDLNLEFSATMMKLVSFLNIKWQPQWSSDFVPTMVGKTWKGTGAYNSRYQTATSGPLENDSDAVAGRVTGPNEYVTKRWMDRLRPSEIHLIELFLRDELQDFSYDLIYQFHESQVESMFKRKLWKLNAGEFPTFYWVMRGKSAGLFEVANRLTYVAIFPLFYVMSRQSFLQMAQEAQMLRSAGS